MLIILADGACSGNPGPIKLGVVIWHRKPGKGRIVKPTHTISGWKGAGTSNEAEYYAIIEGMKHAIILKPVGEEIFIYSDSQIAIRQINEEYATNEPRLKELFKEVHRLKNIFIKHKAKVTFTWVPRQLTMLADKEAKRRLFDE